MNTLAKFYETYYKCIQQIKSNSFIIVIQKYQLVF